MRDYVDESDDRKECDLCGRRFNEEAIVKHTAICEKVFIKRRKEFEASKQRTLNEEHQKFLEVAQGKLSYYQIDKKLNTKWRIHSAQFRAAVASAKTGNIVEGVPDDRIECEHCGRKFSSIPAQRHIPLCAQKASERKFKEAKSKPLSAINKQSTSTTLNRRIGKVAGKR